jgi:hypothetical protein
MSGLMLRNESSLFAARLIARLTMSEVVVVHMHVLAPAAFARP